MAVNGLSDAVHISTGDAHSCAVRTTGQMVCWGQNSHGELGDGSTVDRNAPVTVSGIADANQVAAGGSHTCAVRQTGQAVCWGKNYHGELGDGSLTQRTTPVLVSGLSDAEQVRSRSITRTLTEAKAPVPIAVILHPALRPSCVG